MLETICLVFDRHDLTDVQKHLLEAIQLTGLTPEWSIYGFAIEECEWQLKHNITPENYQKYLKQHDYPDYLPYEDFKNIYLSTCLDAFGRDEIWEAVMTHHQARLDEAVILWAHKHPPVKKTAEEKAACKIQSLVDKAEALLARIRK